MRHCTICFVPPKFLLCLLALTALLAPAPRLQADDAADGTTLAAELCNLRPAENTDLRGTLTVHRRGTNDVSYAFSSQIALTETNWSESYAARGPQGTNQFERVTTIHAPGQPSSYVRVTDGGEYALAFEAGRQSDVPLAGSDFLLTDLGREFFHWPGQRLVKHDMRKGRACRVLESKPGSTNFVYSRVLTWIDNESDGIVMAEAYDRAGKLLKEFEVGKVSKDAAGRWQLREMEIRNVQTKGRTLMEFDISQTNAPAR